MARFRSMAVGCAIAVVAASGATVLCATDAGAKLIRTTISLAEFKSVYGLASLRKMIDNGGGRLGGIVVYSQRLDFERCAHQRPAAIRRTSPRAF